MSKPVSYPKVKQMKGSDKRVLSRIFEPEDGVRK
jgi:hypothetical protein